MAVGGFGGSDKGLVGSAQGFLEIGLRVFASEVVQLFPADVCLGQRLVYGVIRSTDVRGLSVARDRFGKALFCLIMFTAMHLILNRTVDEFGVMFRWLKLTIHLLS